MKYFTALLVSAVTFVFLGGTVAADAARFWRVQISEPTTQTTSKTLRINYNVQSTFDDTFTVRLFENGGIRSTEAVNNPGGDSGKFVVSIPATGTYNYFVRATNNQAGESKNSRVVTVEVVNEPEATTVTVVQQPAGGQGAGGAGGDGAVVAAAGDAGGAQADGAGDGQVLAQGDGGDAQDGENGEGQTTDDAATAQEGQDDGSVLGEEANEAQEESGGTSARVAIILALIAAAVGYGAYRYSPKSRE